MQSRWSLVQGADGNPAGFLVINTDIAEKKRLEAQFLRVQRTESIGLLAGAVVLLFTLAAAGFKMMSFTEGTKRITRNFYGVLRINENDTGSSLGSGHDRTVKLVAHLTENSRAGRSPRRVED